MHQYGLLDEYNPSVFLLTSALKDLGRASLKTPLSSIIANIIRVIQQPDLSGNLGFL